MEEVTISFIIPVYNGEGVIERASGSILSEQKIPVELLIVDDGSTDKTGEVCDSLAAHDARVHVFHTENQGQGLARNVGIYHAKGKYLFFCDADDTVEWTGIHKLLAADDSDIYDIVCGLYYRREDGVRIRVGTDIPSGEVRRHGTRQQEALFHRMKTESLFGTSCNKLYRRSFLEQHKILFEDIRKIYMEDQLFNLVVFSKNPRYYLENVPVFEYIYEGESTTRRAVPEIAEKNAAFLSCYGQYLEKNGLWEENMDLYVPLAMRVICYSLFKNIPYEGVSYRKLKERIACFCKSPEFCRMLSEKRNIRQLWKLPSRIQALFYSYCFMTAGAGNGTLLTVPFLLGYPVMKRYIEKTLK